MSGGHFDYDQYKISEIADAIERVIQNNNSGEVDEYGYRIGYDFSNETIQEFHAAVANLKIAFAYAHRIDWLLEGDDNEETFHKRLKEDLEKVSRRGLL